MIRWAAILIVSVWVSATQAFADGIVSAVTSAPIHANGIVRDVRSGLNIHLQTDSVRGLDFMDPAIPGYGIPPGGRLEVELVSGFQRDPAIALDDRSILLVVGTPQQGLPAGLLGLSVNEGDNKNTFVITANSPDGVSPDQLLSPAPGAAFDPIRAKGIKIVHVGRTRAFVSRGETGVVEVRFRDRSGSLIAGGRGEVAFLPEPRPQVYPTNVPHDQRNHNWQRLPVRNIVGVASNTLPIPLMLYARDFGIHKKGILGAGVLSSQQLQDMKFEIPQILERFNGGLIIQDTNGDGVLDPRFDTILGGVSEDVPKGAGQHFVLTPLVNERPFLSVPTSRFNERAGANIGGAIMQVVYVVGDKPGIYRPTFTLLERPGDIESPDGSSYTYTVVAEPE